jgi:diacylglycerol kinase (ATP)
LSAPCRILLNHRAKSVVPDQSEAQVLQFAQEVGLEAEVISTESPVDLSNRVRQLVREGAEKVVIGGGDGTVSIAVQQLANSETALGILPMGTANNFATALQLPMDLLSALEVIRDGDVADVGLGKVCGRYFTESAGVGLFADALALYGRDPSKSLVRGFGVVMRVVFSMRAHRLQISADGEKRVERAVMCVVANSFRMGLGVPVAPRAKLTDDDLDIVIVGDLTRRELVPYYRAFCSQTHLNLPKITTLRAREVRIETRHPVNAHSDDQIVGTTPVTVTSHPGALKVLVKRL